MNESRYFLRYNSYFESEYVLKYNLYLKKYLDSFISNLDDV